MTLLRMADGDADHRIATALDLLVEQLDLDLAYVSRFEQGMRHVTHVSGGGEEAQSDGPVPQDEALCYLIATGAVGELVPDAGADEALASHPDAPRTGAYVGVPVVVGQAVVGAVCGMALAARPNWTSLDRERVATIGAFVAEVIGEVIGEGDAPATPPDRQGNDVALPILASAVAAADTLEELTRPLLQLLHQVTGLESTYLTTVDWTGNEQRINYSFNVGGLTIPEGITLDWNGESLCHRAMREDRVQVPDVPAQWPDAGAAAALGIKSFVTVPIQDVDDAVIGTLCGVSAQQTELGEQQVQSMRLFARILGDQLHRERARAIAAALAADLERRTRELTDDSARDSLTGLLNRHGIHEWLRAVIPALRPNTEQLALSFIDVDRFKSVNDTYGHAVGDQVLQGIATSLATVGRVGDLHGRLGGDEFVVAAVLPLTAASIGNWTSRLQTAAVLTHDGVDVSASIGVVSITDPAVHPDDALHRADQAMYRVKKSRAVSAPR